MVEDSLILQKFEDEKTRHEAFSMLLNKYQQKVYWHVRRIVINHDDTDDLVQDVFIKVWKGLANFREDSQLYTWLYKIATNESLTFIASQNKRKSISFSDEESNLSNKIVADQHFDANKIEWKLQLAIQKLPEKQRVVFLLRYYDEMPYGQMSTVLETSEGALKASYHHAVKKIEDFILNH